MIIISGIGRCGTSFLTKVFKEAGYNVGSDRWFESMNAGLENKQTLDINARLIRHYIKGEDINLHHVRGDIQELHYDVVKDPQFLAHPGLIREWAAVRDDIEVIWCRRDYEQIAASMKRNPDWNTRVYRLFPEMMEQKELDFALELDELGLGVYNIEWPDILTDHKRFCVDFGIDPALFKLLVE